MPKTDYEIPLRNPDRGEAVPAGHREDKKQQDSGSFIQESEPCTLPFQKRGSGNKLSVAIVGAGLMGYWHAKYASREGGEITAIVDRSADAADRLGRSFPRASRFDEIGKCLDGCQVDVIHICSNAESHPRLVEAALDARKHTLVEKPMVRAFSETERLVSLAHQKNVLLCPVHQFPFQTGFIRLQKNLCQLGQIVRITHQICSAGGAGHSNPERREILLDMLPHSYSLFRSLLHNSMDNYSWEVHRHSADDLEIRSEWDNLVLETQLSLRGRPTCNELHVVGTKATMHVDLFHGFCVRSSGHVSRQTKLLRPFVYGTRLLWAAGTNLGRRILTREPAYPGLRPLIADFYKCISKNTAPPVNQHDIVENARFVDGIRASVSLLREQWQQ